MIPHLGFRVRVHYHDSMCSGLSVFIVCLQMWETLNPTSNSSSLRACLSLCRPTAGPGEPPAPPAR